MTPSTLEHAPNLRTTPRRNTAKIAGLIGLVSLVVIVGAVVLAPVIAPYDPLAQDLSSRLEPPVWVSGDATHILGTDQLGRDTASRLLYGGRLSLSIGAFAATCAGLIGLGLGLVSGFFRGVFDAALQSVAYAQLALPFILLAIALAAALGPSIPVVLLVLIISNWVVFTRVIRGSVLSIRERPFIDACYMIGLGPIKVLLRHVIPHVVGVFSVLLTIQIGRMILLESALSFLGLGIQPPQATWGSMINGAQEYSRTAPWLAIIPGVAIIVTVLSISAVSAWLRAASDARDNLTAFE